MRAASQTPPQPSPRLAASGLLLTRGSRRILDDVDLSVAPGELVAVIGPSGAGKSTLLTALAGTRPVDDGRVTIASPSGHTTDAIGYVPQDDILHTELPLGRTLRHAAGLRLTAGREQREERVREVLGQLGLASHSDTPVGSLSGGQRKRASIAVEMLRRPGVFLLDEPTSGLDPAAARALIDGLSQLTARGSAVVFTTHSVADVRAADRVVVMAPGGRVVHDGPPEAAASALGLADLVDVYDQLPTSTAAPSAPGSRSRRRRSASGRARVRMPGVARPSAARQWWVLSRRAAETLVHNRLTLAILAGSPAAVVAMFAVLFQPGAFGPGADPTAAVMEAFWLSFAGFFFGLTYGLLQVCGEVPVLRRDVYSGVRPAAYLAAKACVLLPFLLVVDAVMLVVLRVMDRLPALAPEEWLSLFATMGLNASAALFLGLLASSVVASEAQAALALPMLCFPAVLFSGAMVPVPLLTSAGSMIATLMQDRWAFEAIACHLGVPAMVPGDSAYATLGDSPIGTYWLILSGFCVVLATAAYRGVSRRAR
jgi:ABC-type multidrug transport system ATPase subunit